MNGRIIKMESIQEPTTPPCKVHHQAKQFFQVKHSNFKWWGYQISTENPPHGLIQIIEKIMDPKSERMNWYIFSPLENTRRFVQQSLLASPAQESRTYNDHHQTKRHRPSKLIREHARNNINFKKIDPTLEAQVEDSPKGWDLIGVKGWCDRKAITPPILVATSWRRKGVLDGAREVG
jgi:hypothetical protein